MKAREYNTISIRCAHSTIKLILESRDLHILFVSPVPPINPMKFAYVLFVKDTAFRLLVILHYNTHIEGISYTLHEKEFK